MLKRYWSGGEGGATGKVERRRVETTFGGGRSTALWTVPLVERVGGSENPASMVQSHAILRWIGRYHDTYGVFGESNSLVDLVSDGTEDVRKRLMKAVYAPEEEKKEKMEAYFSDDAPVWLAYFERIAENHKSLKSSIEIHGLHAPTFHDGRLFTLRSSRCT